MVDVETFVKPIGAATALGILWLIEGVLPMFEGRVNRVRHGLANVVLGVGNAVIVAFVFAGTTLFVTEWAREHGIGLLHVFALPTAVRLTLAVVIFDAWQYLWHRLNHQIPVLWRFHAVHHADRAMDASTALRFHTGEIILSSTARLAVIPILGMTVGEVLVYESVLLPIILFHHSNVSMPNRVDTWFRWLIVTPWMHWVHHSSYQPETDSNYSSIFSFWDRLFGSFRLRADADEIQLGLENMRQSEWADLRGMLTMPFRRDLVRRDRIKEK